MDGWDSGETLLPLAPVARLTRPLGLGVGANPLAVLAGVTYCQGLLLGSSLALQCPQQLHQHLPVHTLVPAQAAPQLGRRPGGVGL